MGSTPGTGMTPPSSDSSPSSAHAPTRGAHLPGGEQDADGDGDVVGSAVLAPVGRRQVDRDAGERVVEAGVPDGAADSLACLRERCVRQPHDLAARQAGRDVHLDAHELPAQAADDRGVQDREHGRESGERHFTAPSPILIGSFVATQPARPEDCHRRLVTGARRPDQRPVTQGDSDMPRPDWRSEASCPTGTLRAPRAPERHAGQASEAGSSPRPASARRTERPVSRPPSTKLPRRRARSESSSGMMYLVDGRRAQLLEGLEVLEGHRPVVDVLGGREDALEGLAEALRLQDGRLAVALGAQDGRLLLALGDVDRWTGARPRTR